MNADDDGREMEANNENMVEGSEEAEPEPMKPSPPAKKKKAKQGKQVAADSSIKSSQSSKSKSKASPEASLERSRESKSKSEESESEESESGVRHSATVRWLSALKEGINEQRPASEEQPNPDLQESQSEIWASVVAKLEVKSAWEEAIENEVRKSQTTKPLNTPTNTDGVANQPRAPQQRPGPDLEEVTVGKSHRVSEIYDPDSLPPPGSFQYNVNKQLMQERTAQRQIEEAEEEGVEGPMEEGENEAADEEEAIEEGDNDEPLEEEIEPKPQKPQAQPVASNPTPTAGQPAIGSEIAVGKSHRVSEIYDPDCLPPPGSFQFKVNQKLMQERIAQQQIQEAEEGGNEAAMEEQSNPKKQRPRAQPTPSQPAPNNGYPAIGTEIRVGKSRRVSEIYDPDCLPPPGSFQYILNQKLAQERMAQQQQQQYARSQEGGNGAAANARPRTRVTKVRKPSLGTRTTNNLSHNSMSGADEYQKTALVQFGAAENHAFQAANGQASYTSSELRFLEGDLPEQNENQEQAEKTEQPLTEAERATKKRRIGLVKGCIWFLFAATAWAYTVNLLDFTVAYVSVPPVRCDVPLRDFWGLLFASWFLDVVSEVTFQITLLGRDKLRGLFKWTWLFSLFTLLCKVGSAGVKIIMLSNGIQILIAETCSQSGLYRCVQNSIALGSVMFLFQFVRDAALGVSKAVKRAERKRGSKFVKWIDDESEEPI